MRVDEIKKVNLFQGPHVVLLGAGASRAAFPNGDRNGKLLPVMNDFIDILNLKDILTNNITMINFEKVYPHLDDEQKIEIGNRVFEYFAQLMLPDVVTYYDRLLLYLRDKDAIFTFNWDPFLFDAHKRNCDAGLSLPKIFFLHGNVRIGSCKKDENYGERFGKCPVCTYTFEDSQLLYPIEEKDYTLDACIKKSWIEAEKIFAAAFTITIFGYGAPSSDINAVQLLKKSWLSQSVRSKEHIEIIDIDESKVRERWNEFTPTHHFLNTNSFENSRLWDWPRRSCEALYIPMSLGMPCHKIQIPYTDNLDELQKSLKYLADQE